MQKVRGTALIEILFVGFILAFLFTFLLRSYIVTQNKRVITSSAMTLVDTLRSSHLYAQTAKDRKSWGVISTDDVNYALISWDPTGDRSSPTEWEIEETNRLNPGVRFGSGFSIYYYADSGDSTGGTINLLGRGDLEAAISVNESGIVEMEYDD